MHYVIEEVMKKLGATTHAEVLVDGFPNGASVDYLGNGAEVSNASPNLPPYLRFVDAGTYYQVLKSADKATWEEVTGEEAEKAQLALLYTDARVFLPFADILQIKGDDDNMTIRCTYDVSQTKISPMVKEDLQQEKRDKVEVTVTVEDGQLVEVAQKLGIVAKESLEMAPGGPKLEVVQNTGSVISLVY